MKKTVRSSNLALRFYKYDGWTRECLEKYLLSGEIRDTEFSHHKDSPETAYFSTNLNTRLDLGSLYENEVSEVIRAYDDYPYQTDLEFMASKL